MRLVKQMIIKKLEKYDEDLHNSKYEVWDFYQALNLVSAVHKLPVEMTQRNKLYQKMLQSSGNRKHELQIELVKIAEEDRKFVIEFLKEMVNIDSGDVAFGKLEDRDSFAVQSDFWD